MRILLISILLLGGCAVKATKSENGTMILRGFGAKSASWPEGYSIEKSEPLKIPDILTK